jgi:hypothetical protein
VLNKKFSSEEGDFRTAFLEKLLEPVQPDFWGSMHSKGDITHFVPIRNLILVLTVSDV